MCCTPASMEVAEHCLVKEVKNRDFFFSLLMCAQTFTFALLNCLISSYELFSIFSLASPAEGGVVDWLSGHLASSQG